MGRGARGTGSVACTALYFSAFLKIIIQE